MKSKLIALTFLCIVLFVGCTDDSSSEKETTSKTTTTTANKDITFEATVLKAADGYITLVDAELTDGNGEKIGESRLEYGDSVKVPSDIKAGDKIKVIVGEDFGIVETAPPIITNVKNIEKIS